jgi:hypothetical protein
MYFFPQPSAPIHAGPEAQNKPGKALSAPSRSLRMANWISRFWGVTTEILPGRDHHIDIRRGKAAHYRYGGQKRVAGGGRPFYSNTKMSRFAHISLRIFGHTVTLTSPRCALRRRSISVRDWPMPPPIESGISLLMIA